MTKKSNRPYSNTRSNRDSRNTVTRVKKNENIKKKFTTEKNKSLESTTRIRVDKERLNDFDSLDTSFLEGRRYKSTSNNKKSSNVRKKKNKSTNAYSFLKNICFFLGTVIIIILSVLLLFDDKYLKEDVNDNTKTHEKDEVKSKKKQVIDDNYLFIGGYHTENYNFSDYNLDYHYVNVAKKDYVISDYLDNMKKYIYDFNPSIIFIELGITDLKDKKSIDQVVEELDILINNIKENRVYATIYLESLYPYNKDVDKYDKDFFEEDLDVTEYNKKLKDLAKVNKIKYLDVYKELSQDGMLNSLYSDDGIHLNKEGYDRLNKMINKVIEDEHDGKKD